jgi:carboxylesterase
VDSVKANYQTYLQGDNGKAVLLMHGLTSGAAQMIPMARFINDYGYTVCCVNLAGHGTYPEEINKTTAEDMVLKAKYDYENLRKYHDTVYVGGISTGGLLSLMLASIYPEIRGIVSIAAPAKLVPGSFISVDYADKSEFLIRPLEGKTGIFKKYHIHYERIAVRIFDELRRLMDIVVNEAVLSEVKCPVLLIHSGNDDIAEPGSVGIISNMLVKSEVEVFQPSTGGHLSVLSEDREHVFRKTIDFLGTR